MSAFAKSNDDEMDAGGKLSPSVVTRHTPYFSPPNTLVTISLSGLRC